MPRSAFLGFKSGEVTNCPTCGYQVRIMYREEGEKLYADHFEHMQQDVKYEPPPLPKEESYRLKNVRKGKKTVAMVGMAPATCGMAPYHDKTIPIWGINVEHVFPWMKRWDRWFQMHSKSYFSGNAYHNLGEGVHYKWLQEKHGKPIYMQRVYEEVPDSTEYPIYEVSEKFFPGKLWRGTERMKFFTSGLDFMIALALYEGYNRIEIYGFEMSSGEEYIPQRNAAYFWAGVASTLGAEIYIPPTGFLYLKQPMYGYYWRQGGILNNPDNDPSVKNGKSKT